MAEQKKWRVSYQRNHESCLIPEGLEAWGGPTSVYFGGTLVPTAR